MVTRSQAFDLSYWINERYDIKCRRESGLPPPWTGDPIMAGVRWCNVHREDDAVTRWMRQSWNYQGTHPVWWWVLGRMLNYTPTLALIMSEPEDRRELTWVSSLLKDERANGNKVFTSAYTISTCGKSMDKIDYVMRVVKDVQAQEHPGDLMKFSTLQNTWERLQGVDGLGSFLAAQVVADLKNTKGHPLQDAPDWWQWAAPGPGSLRGLSWYYRNSPEGVTPRMFKSAIEQCYSEVMPLVHERVPRISMQDFQNCLCEFSKYMKVKHLNGHVRNKYRPGSAG